MAEAEALAAIATARDLDPASTASTATADERDRKSVGNFAALRRIRARVDVVDSKVAAMEDHVLWRVKANVDIDARYAYKWRLSTFFTDKI